MAKKGWSPTYKGAIVDIVAPSWRVREEDFEASLQFVEKLGLKPRYSKPLFGKDLLCGNSLEKRKEYFLKALRSKDSDFVWALRGGHGAADLLPFIHKIKPVKNKIFIGFSDITSLHLFFNQKWNWKTLHGPNLNGLGANSLRAQFVKEVKSVIFGEKDAVEFKKLRPLNETARKNKTIKSSVLGGNLVVATSLLGTPYMGRFRGKILFFEDVGERAYRIDRVLTQWEQAGLLDGVKGIVLGEFTNCEDRDGKSRVPGVWKRFAERIKIPVLTGVECGHGRVQRPVPFNTNAVLKTGKQPSLICESGCV